MDTPVSGYGGTGPESPDATDNAAKLVPFWRASGELPCGTTQRVQNSESNEVFSETRYGLDGVVHKENSKKTIARRTGRSTKERGRRHTGGGFEKDWIAHTFRSAYTTLFMYSTYILLYYRVQVM
jgi:hypothetical protein